MRKFEIMYKRSGKSESVILLAENLLSAIYKASLDSRVIFTQVYGIMEVK